MSNSLTPRITQGAVDIPEADILHGRQRAGDADRNRYIDHLSECHRLGYIPADVFHARMAAVAEAVTKDQLERFTVDLHPLPPLRVKRSLRGRLSRTTKRRWLHLIAATMALCWAVLMPMMLYTLTGFPVVYGTGNWAWEVTQHSGLAVAAMVFCGITGGVGFIANLLWWIGWEDGV